MQPGCAYTVQPYTVQPGCADTVQPYTVQPGCAYTVQPYTVQPPCSTLQHTVVSRDMCFEPCFHILCVCAVPRSLWVETTTYRYYKRPFGAFGKASCSTSTTKALPVLQKLYRYYKVPFEC